MRIIICMEVDPKQKLNINEIVEMIKGPGHLGGESEMLDISEVDVYTGEEMKLVPIYPIVVIEEDEKSPDPTSVPSVKDCPIEEAAFVPEPTLVPKRSRARQPHSKEQS